MLIPGGFLIGMGVGLAMGQVAAGMFIGVGIGFVLSAVFERIGNR
ncbi:hypothetical protein [Ureibacillus acetophenoni]